MLFTADQLHGIHQFSWDRKIIEQEKGNNLNRFWWGQFRRRQGFFPTPRNARPNRLTLWPAAARELFHRTLRRKGPPADDRYLSHGRVSLRAFQFRPWARNPPS